ncbi:enterochelin esterase [Cnuella takakiae]|uniref:Enterochelin esterase n=1 Tax=Cnuella takakiae TaxID=1302690 RepID=A0A1M4YX21_9BACT|nr:esterase [Cnuella takakiae]OLY94399.1 esterase [Cnuella takakiae]SHF10265.1 enterochelin esterase [Cnuella takakiae]
MRHFPVLKMLFTWAVFCLSAIALAQPPRGPFVVSPQVLPDKKVSFRYLAPAAKEVRLSGGQFGAANVPMTKDSIGIWSITVGPVRPDIYPYNFVVDGVSVMDPANEDFFPNERFKASLVDVPGFTPLVHAMQDVPHGAVSYEYYPSAQGSTGSVVVYTPPGYDKNNAARYPVFYLISGTTDTEETFFKVGRTNLILDNLIAAGKAKPMIVVMPYGNVDARVAEQKGGVKPADPVGRESEDAMRRMRGFSDDMTQNIIPYIDKAYRTIPNRDNRAIGGFSRGGGQTLRTAFWNMNQFAWVCCYSAYLPPSEMDGSYASLVSNPDATNKQLKLLWVGVGTEDFLYNDVATFLNYLNAKKIGYKSLITGGGHTWMNVKTYLTETAQLLFK